MKRASLRVLGAAICALAFAREPASSAATDPVALAAPDASFDAAAKAALADLTAPGFSTAIVRDGDLVYARGFGMRDIAEGKPVDANTIFALGPVTKQFTAAAILMLVATQKVALDAKVATYLPAAPHASEIRVRNLLDETSGLPEYLDRDDLAAMTTSSSIVPAALLDAIAAKPLDFPPGTRYESTGTNYVMLGAVIEAVSGMPYAEFIRRRIAAPIGLTTLGFGPPPGTSDLSLGYDLAHYDLPVTRWTAQATAAAGGLYACAADVAKWQAAFFGGTLLPQALIAELITPPVLADGSTSEFAGGSFVDAIDGLAQISERGGQPGASAIDSWIPELHASIVVLGNSIAFDPRDLVRTDASALEPKPISTEHESDRETSRARDEYRAWEYGTVDPARYADAMHALVSSAAALDVTNDLRAAGDPTAFVFEGSERVASGASHRYRVETARATFVMTIVYGASGTIASINFSRVP